MTFKEAMAQLERQRTGEWQRPGLLVSELITQLQKLKEEWGDILVVCAPYTYREPPPELYVRSGRWPWSFRRIWPLVRTPEPAAWGLPGLGSPDKERNPAREITL